MAIGLSCRATWLRALQLMAPAALSLLPKAVCANERLQAMPPAEVFWGAASIHEVVLAPNGQKLAVVSRKLGARRALVVLDLKQRGRASGVLELGDGDVGQVRWVNNERLFFAAGIFDKARPTERTPTGFFAINADGTEFLQLSNRGYQLANEEQAGAKVGFPMFNGTAMLLSAPIPKTGQANEEVLAAFVDERRTLTPFWLNVRTREQRMDDFGLEGSIRKLLLSPEGKVWAAVVSEGTMLTAMRRLPGTGEWAPMPAAAPRDYLREVVAVDNDGAIYATGYAGTRDCASLFKLTFPGGIPRTEQVAEVAGFDFQGQLVTDVADGERAGVRVQHARETTIWRSAAMRAFQANVDRMLPGMVNRIECARCGSPDMVAVIRSFSDQDPGRVRIYRGDAERPEERWMDIGPIRPGIAPSRMATMEFERIQARDQRDLPVWVTRPAGMREPLPAIVLVHGGPWIRGGSWQWHPLQQFLASRGYVVIEPEMRGSMGYGRAHFEAGFRQFGQSMQDDVADALLWARKRGLADGRACIMGASYGGYSALMGLIRHPDLYRCAIAQIATADLSLYLEGSFWVDDDISSLGRKNLLPRLVGDARKDAEMIAANSPVQQAARIKSPVLLAYGEKDRRIPLAHGKRMRQALTEAGNPPEWVTYPGEAHGGWALNNELDFAWRVEAFLARHLSTP